MEDIPEEVHIIDRLSFNDNLKIPSYLSSVDNILCFNSQYVLLRIKHKLYVYTICTIGTGNISEANHDLTMSRCQEILNGDAN